VTWRFADHQITRSPDHQIRSADHQINSSTDAMFSTSDTIVAIATPAGRGGIGVVRISGDAAESIARRLTGRPTPFTPRHATLVGGRPRNSPCPETEDGAGGDVRDRSVVTFFQSPQSYTGEDVVEISAHGSPVVLNAIVRAAVEAGARLAEPGEFTLRAFLHNKIDLVQAEAVGDLIDAVTPLQARAAFDQLEGTLTSAIAEIEHGLFDVMAKLEASLDFPDEGYHFVEPGEAGTTIRAVSARIDALLAQASRGRLIREGAQVAIVGAPNVGKSSLFNALLNTDRAIVTAVPGTTRDVLTERADIGGLSLALIDTAGVRETSDIVEREGVSRSRDTLRVADLVIVVLDRSRPLTDDDREILRSTENQPRVVVANKSDLAAALTFEGVDVELSATTGAGIDRLIETIANTLTAAEPLRDQPQITNTRHSLLLERAKASLDRAAAALDGQVSEEFPLLDLQEAAQSLQEITGKKTSDDLLHHIFARFCIGK
jgi:tRNA modification GTPase